MPNIIIRPARGGGDPIIEFTGSAGGESRIQIESDGKISFVGATKFANGLSGSLQTLESGEAYLKAGAGITISTGSSPLGQVTIASTITQVSPGSPSNSVQFNSGGSFTGDSSFTFDNSNDTLSVQNVIVSGDLTVNGTMATVNTTNLEVKDSVIGLGFSSGTIAEAAGDRGFIGGLASANNVAVLWKNADAEFVLGRTTSSATGSFGISAYSNLHVANVQADIVTASLGFTGSLTKLVDGSDYLRAGANITLTTGALGDVTIGTTGVAPDGASYLTLNSNATLTNERAFAAGTGLSAVDLGANSTYTLNINDSVVATISGSTFSGVVKFNGGMSGSLQRLASGEAYLNAGAGITISTGSSPAGQITIASTITQVSPGSPLNSVQFNNAGSFAGDSRLAFTPSVTSGQSSLDLSGKFGQGFGVSSTGAYSHAEGDLTVASGERSHAEGSQTEASNFYSHAEGQLTKASGQAAHAEGYLTTGSATAAHAEGHRTEAIASYSHTAGIFTIASGSGQNVVGKYNKRNNTDSLFIVGNGDADVNANRSDIFLVNTGSVLIGSASLASDTFFYVGTKGTATNTRFDGNAVISGTLDVKNGSANSILSVNGSKVGVNTSSPSYTLEVNGDFAATTKSFVINHPSKQGWKLRHGSLEGPENGVYVRGRTNSSEVVLPAYWADLVDEDSITVHITPVRSKLTYFVSYIGVDKICVDFDAQNVEYCYLVQASRKDETFEVEFPSS